MVKHYLIADWLLTIVVLILALWSAALLVYGVFWAIERRTVRFRSKYKDDEYECITDWDTILSKQDD
ncbi:hypothetical protein [Tellurirhabdus bombi]|uniref:hypothetical protein n=1 Tax=Tellurirhabdus bombi TaxID=2907205 RepID=UPI001F1BBE4D|nr:hypothetical protein [Tellurirhabdus bombi]